MKNTQLKTIAYRGNKVLADSATWQHPETDEADIDLSASFKDGASDQDEQKLVSEVRKLLRTMSVEVEKTPNGTVVKTRSER